MTALDRNKQKRQQAEQMLQESVTGGSGSGAPSLRTPTTGSGTKTPTTTPAPTTQKSSGGTMSWGDYNRYNQDYGTWSTTGQHVADYSTWSTPQGNNAYQLIANRVKNGAQVALIGDQYYAMDKGKYNQYEQDYKYWTKTHKHMPGFEQWSDDADLETWRTIRDYNIGVQSGQNPSMELQGFINGLDPQALEATRAAYQKDWSYDMTDPEDMARQAQGLPPKNKDKYYGKSELDQWLYSQGLPSTKSNYFSKQYSAQAEALAQKRAEWADQPAYDFSSNEQAQQMGSALAEYWKSTWTYTNSAEDKQRQREGKPPKALDKLYTESEIDQYYKEMGLPPASEIDSYITGFDAANEAYTGLVNEYMQRKYNAPWEDSRMILEGIMQDDSDGKYRDIIAGMGLDEDEDLTGLEGDDFLSAYLGTGKKKKSEKSTGPFALTIEDLESLYGEAFNASWKEQTGQDYKRGDSLFDYVTGSTGEGLDGKTFDFVKGYEDLGYDELSQRIAMIDYIRQEIDQPLSLSEWTAEYGGKLSDDEDPVNAYHAYKEEWERNHPLDKELQDQRRKLFRARKKFAREKGSDLDAAYAADRAAQYEFLGNVWGASPEFVKSWIDGKISGGSAEMSRLGGEGSVYKTTQSALEKEYDAILAADNDPNSERNQAIEARTSELMQQMLSTWAAQDAQRRIEQFKNDPDWETIRAQAQSMADAGWERFEIEDQFPRDIEKAALDDVYGPEDTGEYVPSEADRKLAESEARKRAELEYPSDAQDAAIGLNAWESIMDPQRALNSYRETETGDRFFGDEYLKLSRYMTEDQLSEFIRISQDEGAVAAGKYWKELRPELEEKRSNRENADVQYDVEGKPLGSSIESILLSLPAGVEGIRVELAALKGDYRQNDWRGEIGRRKSGLQQWVSLNIRQNNGALASFLYDTTMSMADSLQSMALGDVGLALTSFRAAADTVNDAVEKGADSRDAGILGLVSWAAEFVTEKMNMDRLFEMKNDGSFTGFLKMLVIEGAPEALEEGVSDLAEIIGETFILADQSEFMQHMSQFEAEGASTTEAFGKTLLGYAAPRIGLAMAGGALSGIAMGTAFAAQHGGKIAHDAGYSWFRFQKGFKILNEYEQALEHGKAFDGSMSRVYSDITQSGISPDAQVAAAGVFQTATQMPSQFTSEQAMNAVTKLNEMIQKAVERNNIYDAQTAEARTKSQNRLTEMLNGIQTAYQNAGAALQSGNLEVHARYLNEMRGLMNKYNMDYSEVLAAMRTKEVQHDAELAQQERDVQAATTAAQAGLKQAGDTMLKVLFTNNAILVDQNGQAVQVGDDTLAKIRSGEIDVDQLIRESGETAGIGVAQRMMGYGQQAPEESAAEWARGIMDPEGYWAKRPRNEALKALQREYQNRNESLRSQYDQAVAEGRSSDASRIREDMRVLSQQYEAAQASINSGEAGIGAVSTAEQATGPNVMKGARLETEADKVAGGTTTTGTETAAPTTETGAVTESARAAQERAEVEADRAQVETEQQAQIREEYQEQMTELEQELQAAVDSGDEEQRQLVEETIDALQEEFDRKYKAAAQTQTETETTTETTTEQESTKDVGEDAYSTRGYEQTNGPSDRTSSGNGQSQSGYAGASGQAPSYQGVDEQTFQRDTGNAARRWAVTTKSGSIPTFERATPSAQTAQIIQNMKRPGGPVVSTYARRNNMPAAFNSTGTRDGNVYVGITGDDGYDAINVPFQIGHEYSEGDAGLRAVGNAVLKKLPRQQVRNLVDNYMAILNEDTDGDIKFPGYADAAKELICDVHGAVRAVEQNPNLDLETVLASLGIDPEVGKAIANAMVDALSDEASTQVPGTTGAELAQQYRDAYKAGVLEPETVAEQLAYLNDGESDGLVNVDGMAENSVRGLANGVGLNVQENRLVPGTYVFTDQNGRVINHVTKGMIKGSAIGTLIDLSLANGYIDQAEADRQYELFAAIANLLIKCDGDFAKAQMFMGSELFTAMKTNSDKQYSFTWDFVSICTKTQAVIDAMSRRMVEKGRGLTDDEILAAYKAVNKIGQPVPCPECYVFSRWVGIGSLLDNINTYQTRYQNMVEERGGKLYATEQAMNEYNGTKQAVKEAAEAAGINPGKAKSKLADKAQKAMNKAEKALMDAASVEGVTQKELAPLQDKYDKCRDAYEKIKSLVWMEKVFFKNIGTGEVFSKNVDGRVVDDFFVPKEVLFDLNKGGEFAANYPRAWAFRTTQGAGYGKAITPYSEGRAGEGIMVIGKGDSYIKAKQSGKAINFFERLVDGKLSADGMKTYKSAIAKELQQAWLGGQRWQSTSDARFENALDYIVAALDTQAMGSYAQSYTKVSEAVEMFAKLGLFPNQSMMPYGNGLEMDENGNAKKDKNGNYIAKDTSVGGMRPEDARANRLKFAGAGTITIGVNDKHIRALMRSYWRDFIIPYHASGGKADLIADFRATQDKDSTQTKVQSSDYTRVQGEKVLSDAALKYLLMHDRGMTQAEFESALAQIKRNRQCRLDILQKKSVSAYADILNEGGENYNPILRRLYDRINSGPWAEMKGLPKGKVEDQIYPNEYWDQTTTYETSGQITRDYLAYCDSLGFLHKFAGVVPANANKEASAAGYTSMLRRVNGRDEHGNSVPLQDLAYVYDENGNKTDQIEDYFWKVLTDRQMYFANADENGQHPYQPQRRVTLGQIDQGVVENFAKVDPKSGKRYYNRDIAARGAEEFAAMDQDAIDAIINGSENTPLAKQLRRGGGYLMDAALSPEGQTEFSGRGIRTLDQMVPVGGGKEPSTIRANLSTELTPADAEATETSGVKAATEEEAKHMAMSDPRNIVRFRNTVDRILQGDHALASRSILLGKPCKMLVESGLGADRYLYMKPDEIEKIAYPADYIKYLKHIPKEDRTVHGHNLGLSIIKNLLQQLDNPLATTQNTEKQKQSHADHGTGTMVVLTDWFAENHAEEGRDIPANRIGVKQSIIIPLTIGANGAVGLQDTVDSVFDEQPRYEAQYLDPGKVIKTRNNEDLIRLLSNRRHMPDAVVDDVFGNNILRADRDVNRDAANYTPERLNYLLDYYGSKTSPKYSKAYVARINPADFIALTSTNPSQIYNEASPLADDYAKGERLPMRLHFDPETGQVTGHEGRHRMATLARQGIGQVAVILIPDGEAGRYSRTKLDTLHLTGQEFSSGIANAKVDLQNVVPLSYEYRDEVTREFTSSAKMNFSSRGLSPKMAEYRINQLEGMVERRDQALADQRREADARLKQARERYRVEKGREQVTARAKQLYDWLQRPTKKEHVPIPLQTYVAGILENLDIGISARGSADTRAFRDAVTGLKDFYTAYVTGAQNRYDFSGFSTTVPPEIFHALDTIERGMEGMPRLGTMNADQVEALKKILGQVRKDTMLANRLMSNARYKSVVELGEQTHRDADEKGTRRIWKLKSLQDLLTTRMMDAFSWAKAVGKGAESVIGALESGMEISYGRIHEGAEWSEKALRDAGIKKKDIRRWGKDKVEIGFENGKTGRFTTAQIMEVYALSKRPQARAHMLTGGIEIADMKNGHRQTDRYVLTETDLNAIIEKLTPQQRKLIDAMQNYLSTDVAEWGNEVWRALYDYEMFGEENYWPIKSAARGVKTQDPEAQSTINALLNMGMTKLTVPNASNPLTINDAFDTWTGHVAQMARLNGLAIPIEDALKWYNWVGSNEDGTRNYDVATKAAVDKVLGPEGSRYFLKLLKDINGLSTGDSGTQFASELMSKYKRAAVAGKLRVVIQQPTAIIRSWAMINPKYFANQTAGQIKKNAAEMQEHSPLAWWKSQGNYDVGTGKSMKSVFFGTDNVLDDITDAAMTPAGWADDFAWSWLWSAVKAETKAEHPELKAGTDGYWQHVSERFADIVNQTQVVDGILQRSDLMRSKNGLDQMASAFMAEPIKGYNMIRNRLMDIIAQAKSDGVKSILVDRKAAKELIRALIAFALSIAVNSAVLAAHDAAKKRNKGDKFSTAFSDNFRTNMLNDIKPWDYVPYIKDVAAIMQGDSVDRMDMSMIEDVYRAAQNGYKYFTGTGSKTGYKVASDLISVAGAMAGVPTTGLIATMETVTNGIAPGFIKKQAYLNKEDRAAIRDAGISYNDAYGIAAQYRTHSWADKSASTNAEKAVYLLKAADAVGASYTDEQFDILSEILGMNATSYDPKKDGHFGSWARKTVNKYVSDKKKKGGLTDEVKERYDGYGDILSELGY